MLGIDGCDDGTDEVFAVVVVVAVVVDDVDSCFFFGQAIAEKTVGKLGEIGFPLLAFDDIGHFCIGFLGSTLVYALVVGVEFTVRVLLALLASLNAGFFCWPCCADVAKRSDVDLLGYCLWTVIWRGIDGQEDAGAECDFLMLHIGWQDGSVDGLDALVGELAELVGKGLIGRKGACVGRGKGEDDDALAIGSEEGGKGCRQAGGCTLDIADVVGREQTWHTEGDDARECLKMEGTGVVLAKLCTGVYLGERMLTKVEFDIATMQRVMAAVPAYVPGLRVGLDLFYKRVCRTQRYVRTFFEGTLLSLRGLLIDIYNGEFHVLLRYEGGPHALFVANLASGPFHGLCLGEGDDYEPEALFNAPAVLVQELHSSGSMSYGRSMR